ncbi:MAG: hypothetical protein WA771_15815 [Chthoniobacterales bacterium]
MILFCTLAPSGSLHANTVRTTVTFIPDSSWLSVAMWTFGGVREDVTFVSGSVVLDVELNAFNQPIRFEIESASLSTTPLTFDFVEETIDLTTLGGTLDDEDRSVSVSDGRFDASRVILTFDSGLALSSGLEIADFSTDPIFDHGFANGGLTITPNADRPSLLDVRFTYPARLFARVTSDVDVDLEGNLVAVGIIAIPEPSAFWVLIIGSVPLTVSFLRTARRRARAR